MRKISIKQFICFALCLCMVFGLTPVSASADGGDVTAPAQYTLTIRYEYADGSAAAAPQYSGLYEEGAAYSIASPSIPGYACSQASVSGAMEATDRTVVVTYTEQADTHTLHIVYSVPDGYDAIAEYSASVAEGAGYSIASPAVDGLVADKASVTGIMGTSDVDAIVHYSEAGGGLVPETHTLTVTYVGPSGFTAPAAYTAELEAGAGYSVASPAVAGFTADTATVAGTMGDADVNVTVTYAAVPAATYTLTITYTRTSFGNTEVVAPAYTAQLAAGEEYSVVSPYNADRIANQAVVAGTMPASNVTVNVTYSWSNRITVQVSFVINNGAVSDTSGTVSLRCKASTNNGRATADDVRNAVIAYVAGQTKTPANDYALPITWSVPNGNYKNNDTVTVTGSFTYVPSSVITLNAGEHGSFAGEASTALTVNDGVAWDSLTLPVPQADEGFLFTGWDAATTGNVTSDVTLTAQYAQLHTVTFTAGDNGGFEGVTGNTVTVSVPSGAAWSTISVPTPVAAEGYQAGAWSPALPADDAAVTEDAAYRVAFEIENSGNETDYTHFVFMVDGVQVSEQYVKNGGELLRPASPAKDNYRFMGWMRGASEQAFGVIDTTKYAENVLVEAAFEQIHYVFFYDAQDRIVAVKGNIEGGEVALNGVAVDLSASQALMGWSATKGGAILSSPITMGTENVNVYAVIGSVRWIMFDSQGGSYVEPMYLMPGAAFTASPATARAGYDFVCWSATVGGEAYTGVPTGDMTLYAVWAPSQTRVRYLVVHQWENANDTEYAYHEHEYLEGTTDSQTQAVAKTHAGFTAQSFEQKTIAGDGSTVVIIKYSRNIYTIRFNRNNNNTEYTNLRIEEKYGADLTGKWPTDPSGMWRVARNGNTYQSNILQMPLGGDEFWSADTGYIEYEAVYNVTVVGNTSVYQKHHSDTYSYSGDLSISEEDRYEIPGFTYNGARNETFEADDDGVRVANFYYTRNQYDIVLHNGVAVSTTPVEYEASLSGFGATPAVPEEMPENAVFLGWYDNSEFAGTPFAFTGNMPAYSLEFYAKWAMPTYEGVAHVTMEGTGATETITVNWGDTLDESQMPEPEAPEGMIKPEFQGWCTKNGDTYIPFNFETRIYNDVELFPFYISGAAVRVVYAPGEATEGTVPVDAEMHKNGASAVTKYNESLKKIVDGKAYAFLGWQIGDAVYFENTAIHIDADAQNATYNEEGNYYVITLTAKFERTEEKINISYNPNFPSIPLDNAYLGNISIVTYKLPNSPFQLVVTPQMPVSGNGATVTFLGWGTSATSGVVYSGGQQNVRFDADTTLYAQWRVTYTIAYTLDGEPYQAAQAYEVGAVLPAAPAVTPPEGYEFLGWETETPAAMPAENLVINGTTAKKVYQLTVKYQYAGGAEAAADAVSDFTFGDPYSVTSPVITGYTADKPTVSGTMPAGNVTETVTYSIHSHKLTINYKYADGTQAAASEEMTLNYDDGYSVTSPVITGYKADKLTVTGTMGDQDITVDVTYSINSYNVKYIITGEYFATAAGETFRTVTVPYGATLSYIGEDMARDGYTFSSWSAIPASMPAGDLTITGSYSINTYSVEYSWTWENEAAAAGLIPDLPEGSTNVTVLTPYTVDTTFTSATVVSHKDAFGNVDGEWTFSGWDKSGELTVTGDIAITGEWSYEAKTVATWDVTYSWTGAPTGAYAQTIPSNDLDITNGDTHTVDTTFTSTTVVSHKDAFGNVDGEWTFSGWDMSGTLTVTGDIAITGTWTYAEVDVATWDVTYSWTGAPTGVYAQTIPANDLNITNGDTHTVDTTFTSTTVVSHKDAFGNVDGEWTFSGWDKSGELTVTGDIAITGEWSYEAKTVATWDVTYSWTGAPTGVYAQTIPSNVLDITNGDTHTVDTTFTSTTVVSHKDAFGNVDGEWTFSGWDKSGELTVTGDIAITGEWSYEAKTVATWDVTYVSNFGLTNTTREDGPHINGSDVTVLANMFTREGHSFTGWNTAADGAGTAYAAEAVIEKIGANVTLYAQWTANQYQWTIKHVEQGNESVEVATADTGEARYGDPVFVMDYIKTFVGGPFAYAGRTDDILIGVDESKNVATIYYKRYSYDWTIKHIEKDVGTLLRADDTGKALFEDSITVADYRDDTIEGFSFYSVVKDQIVIKPGENIGYILYVRNKHDVKYEITGDYFAQDPYKQIDDVAYNTPLELIPDDMAVDGYTFSGWEGLPATMPAEDVTVTGSYQPKEYTFIIRHHYQNATQDGYDHDAADDVTMTGLFGQRITLTEENLRVRGGFRHNGVFPAGTVTMEDEKGTLVLNLYYNRIKLHVVFVLRGLDGYAGASELGVGVPGYGGIVYRVNNVVYGQPLGFFAPLAPVIEGYTHGSWFGDALPVTMPNHDVVLLVKYEAIPVIPEEPTPTPNPTTEPTPTPTATSVPNNTPVIEIPEEPVAMAGGHNWSLMNLILTVLTAIAAILMLLGVFGRKSKEEDGTQKDINKKKGWRWFSLVPGAGAIITFLLTQLPLTNMVLVDWWTILMAIIAIIQVVVIFLSRKKTEDPTDAAPEA